MHKRKNNKNQNIQNITKIKGLSTLSGQEQSDITGGIGLLLPAIQKAEGKVIKTYLCPSSQ